MRITVLWVACLALHLGLQAVSGQIPVSFDHGKHPRKCTCECSSRRTGTGPAFERAIQTDVALAHACAADLSLVLSTHVVTDLVAAKVLPVATLYTVRVQTILALSLYHRHISGHEQKYIIWNRD